MKSLVVVGAGRHGRVVAETAMSTGQYEIFGFADEEAAKHGQELGRWKVLGHWRDVMAEAYVLGIGSNGTRKRIFESLVGMGRNVVAVISDRASVSEQAQVGRGAVILAGAVIQAGAIIGDNAIINSGVVVDHDAVVGCHAHVGPQATVESFANVRSGEMLPAATVRSRTESFQALHVVAEDEALGSSTLRPAGVESPPRTSAKALSSRVPDCEPGTDRMNSRRIGLSVPHMGGAELDYVKQAFASNWLSTVGPNLATFEERFTRWSGLPSLAVASGTAGLHLALRLAGVGPGDEVMVPTLTFVASCNPVLYQGARPVFLDSERASWNLDAGLLADFVERRRRANRLPKAVVVVHLFGQAADLSPVLRICRAHGIRVIEDAAEALGGVYLGRPVGTYGDVGVFSFNGNKVITATSGGMLVSNDPEQIRMARHWSTQACDPDPRRNYLHSEMGYNYRMSNVLAGIALGQLEVLDLRVQQRRAVFDRYRKAFADLPGIEPQPEAMFGDRRSETADGSPAALPEPNPDLRPPISGSLHTRWLSCFLVDESAFGMSADDLIRHLEAANVESRPVWKPMHTQPLYRGYECVGGEVAEDLNRRGICLPSSSCLTEEEQTFVIERVREAHIKSARTVRGVGLPGK